MPSFRIFTDEPVTDIDPRIYGSFVEHLGRCVYTGIYEPGHPEADEEGWRGDVLDLARAPRIPIVRYPGGNFVSAYRWEDGIGPRDQRPRRLDPAWRTTETNHVGTDEFMQWCRKAGTAPMMAVNLGTRGLPAALALLEYCNHPGGSAWSDLRRRNGHATPYGIRTWCLGNEMDGPWQTGHKTATEYGRLAVETARAMRQFDDKLELVAAGSSSPKLPTFLHWEQEVLGHCYDAVDAISLHIYLGRGNKTLEEYLASPALMDQQIREVINACDFVRARDRHKNEMMLAFDEWNVWDMDAAPGAPPDMVPWSEAPPQVEQTYDAADALVFAGMMLTLLRHAKRVRLACVAQLVNVLGLIMTKPGGPAWKQTIFWPFLHGSLHGRGHLLTAWLRDSPAYESTEFGAVPLVDALATRDGDKIAVFALNRGQQSAILETAFEGGRWKVEAHEELIVDDPAAANTVAHPDAVKPRKNTLTRVDAGTLSLKLSPLSWHCVRLKAA
jgi:alpha-N-arabinofuranosidase